MTQARRQQWKKPNETWQNLCVNPSFEVDSNSWASLSLGTISRTSSQSYTGSWSLYADAGGGQGTAQACYFGGIGALGSNTFSARFAVRNNNVPDLNTVTFYLYWQGGVNAAAYVFQNLVSIGATGVWKTFGTTFTADFADRTDVWIYVAASATDAQGFYLDGMTITKTTYPAPIFDGDSPGASWTGTPHASTSILVR